MPDIATAPKCRNELDAAHALLDVTTSTTDEAVAAAFRFVATVAHPANGGNESDYERAVHAYRIIMRARRAVPCVKAQCGTIEAKPPEIAAMHDTRGLLDAEKFNKLFDATRAVDVNDRGYGHLMAASGAAREEFVVADTIKAENLNEEFERRTAFVGEPVRYANPELGTDTSLPGCPLGVTAIDDFSSFGEGGGIEYTDYMKAYTTSALIDPRTVDPRPRIKSVRELVAMRNGKEFAVRVNKNVAVRNFDPNRRVLEEMNGVFAGDAFDQRPDRFARDGATLAHAVNDEGRRIATNHVALTAALFTPPS
jgi:hypothetical protein